MPSRSAFPALRGVLAALLALALSVSVTVLGPAPARAEEPERVCDPDDPEGYRQVVDLTFPVSGGHWFSDDYHHDRGGGTRKHQATDIVGEKLQGVHAALGGVVTFAPMTKPSYGYMLRIRHDDGLVTSYVHLNDDTPGTATASAGPEWAYAPGIEEGVRVERGQWIGYLGDSGNAKGGVPHLHFEVRLPDELDDPCLDDSRYDKHRINPYPSLVAAEERGDVPPPPDTGASPQTSPEASPDPPEDTDSPSPADGEGADGFAVRRLAGENRVRTAIALSADRGSPANTVVVVPEGSHVEALLSAPLAALVDAPVLLTGTSGLHPDVAAEVARLGARNAYLIGGPEVLAPSTEDDLRDAGVRNLARIDAPDRYALSAAIAEELRSYGAVDGFAEVLLAVGEAEEPSRAWPDALSAGALAAVLKVPILLTKPDELPEPVRSFLADARPPTVRVVGGTAAVSDKVEQAAADAARAESVRLAGPTRYATSAAVATAGVEAGLTAPAVWTATGRSFPDALAAGPAAARAGSPLLLVDGADPEGAPESRAWLGDQAGRLNEAVVVGGLAAITEDVVTLLARALSR